MIEKGTASMTPEANVSNFSKGLCLAEAQLIISRPEFEASERLKNLLVYLAVCSDESPTRRISQTDIAQNVMLLDEKFDPSSDAHVRIEVSRLRAALAGYYSRLRTPLHRRLSIPKGGYRIELTRIQNSQNLSSNSLTANGPVIALGMLCAKDYLSRQIGFEVECETLNEISGSELSTDGLIAVANVEGESLDGLASHAERIGASVLLLVRVSATDRIRIYVSAVSPQSRVVLQTFKFGDWHVTDQNLSRIQTLSRSIAKEVLDPIGGTLLRQVCMLNPDSVLSQLSPVFAFMGSQNRNLLPQAYAAALHHSESSNLAAALAIDMYRASYCFSTNPSISDLSAISDRSEKLNEKDRNSPWAKLAMGYAGISSGREDLVKRAISAVETMPLIGEQQADFRLLKVLSGDSSCPEVSAKMPSQPSRDHTVFDAITNGFDALRDKTDEAANSSLEYSRHSDVFWIQAMQISASLENGRHQNARRLFSKMKKGNPCIHSYMDRAISTMIPVVEIREKILTGLNSVAQ